MNTYLKYKLDYLLIILLSFPILFLKLGSFSLRLWDESIYATNSIEMMERGEWIIPYFNGEMDYWNTKPPMIHWLQIISMKIFGINEFAIRFPSALAALGTLLFVYWFLKKYFNSLTGITGSLVLLTSVGFVTFHGARTGDTDSILTFFMTVSYLLILDIFLSKNISSKKIFVLTLAFVFGFLTKSIAVFLFLPGVLIFGFLFDKNYLLQILKNKWVLLSGGFILLSVFSFIFIRNSMQPGYLDLFMKSDLGRVGTTIEKHDEPFWFYMDNFIYSRYSYWIIFFISSFLLFITEAENWKVKKLIQFTSVLSVFYLIFISVSVTKLAWYDLPLFPVFALNIALLFQFIFNKIQFSISKSVLVLVVLFFLPYRHVFGLSQANHYTSFEMQNEVRERYLKKYITEIHKTGPKRIVVFNNRYNRSLIFYRKIYFEKSIELVVTDQPKFNKGDLYLLEMENISNGYPPGVQLEIIQRFENLVIYKAK